MIGKRVKYGNAGFSLVEFLIFSTLAAIVIMLIGSMSSDFIRTRNLSQEMTRVQNRVYEIFNSIVSPAREADEIEVTDSLTITQIEENQKTIYNFALVGQTLKETIGRYAADNTLISLDTFALNNPDFVSVEKYKLEELSVEDEVPSVKITLGLRSIKKSDVYFEASTAVSKRLWKVEQ